MSVRRWLRARSRLRSCICSLASAPRATFGPLMADMSQWFVRHRGIAVSIAASGNYIGGVLWPPVLQHAMATGGWRHTYLGVGMFCALATLPFIFALWRSASDRVDVRGGEYRLRAQSWCF